VDDAYAFGAIAAANAFSDVYAMGADPLLALNLVAWPRDPKILPLLEDTIRGGADIARQAGALILGGHSIDDPEPKYGMVAVGEVHPSKVLTNAGARVGDRLVLTKPIGTGVLSTALKREMVTEADMAEAVRSMTTLNASGLKAVREVGSAVHAATDVTGFGLFGHLRNILTGSHVSATIFASRVPALAHAVDLIGKGAVAGGTTRNVKATEPFTRWPADIRPEMKTLLNDAQTSGGLLLAVAPEAADHLVRALERHGALAHAIVGDIVAGEGTIEVMA
jgi:selenide,water dikinase